MSGASRSTQIVRGIGIVVSVLSMIVIVIGIGIISTAGPRCILPDFEGTDNPDCLKQAKKRNIGVTIVISGALGVVSGCFMMLYHRLKKEATLITAATSIAAAVAAVAAASAANAAASMGERKGQVNIATVAPSTLGILSGIATTGKNVYTTTFS